MNYQSLFTILLLLLFISNINKLGINAQLNNHEIITNYDEMCLAKENEDLRNCSLKVWHRVDNLKLFHKDDHLGKIKFETIEKCLQWCVNLLNYVVLRRYQCAAAARTKDNPNVCQFYNRNASLYTTSETGSTAYFLKCCSMKANVTDNGDKLTESGTTPEKRVTELTEHVTKKEVTESTEEIPQSPESTIGLPGDHTDSTYDKNEKSESTTDEQIKYQQTTYGKEEQENVTSTYDQGIVTKLTENVSIKQESTIDVPNNSNSTYEKKRDTESTDKLEYQQTTNEQSTKSNTDDDWVDDGITEDFPND